VGAALGCEDSVYGDLIERVRAEPIERVRGIGHQATPLQHSHPSFYLSLQIVVEHAGGRQRHRQSPVWTMG
jgi:hypothetical protein